MIEYLKQVYITKSTGSSALVAKLNDVANRYMMSENVVLCEDGPCDVLYTDKYYCGCKMSICVPVSKQAIKLNSIDNDFICKVIRKRLYTYCPHCFEVPPVRGSLETEKLESTKLIPLKAKKTKIVNRVLKMVISLGEELTFVGNRKPIVLGSTCMNEGCYDDTVSHICTCPEELRKDKSNGIVVSGHMTIDMMANLDYLCRLEGIITTVIGTCCGKLCYCLNDDDDLIDSSDIMNDYDVDAIESCMLED
jgi:hypothetical protein